jgi:hypothetical protein
MYDAADKSAVMLTEDTLEQVILPLATTLDDSNELQIYPNPVQLEGAVFIDFSSTISNITVFTASGQKVNCNLVKSEGNRYKIEGIKTAGVYFIRIQSGNKHFTKKIVKSN